MTKLTKDFDRNNPKSFEKGKLYVLERGVEEPVEIFLVLSVNCEKDSLLTLEFDPQYETCVNDWSLFLCLWDCYPLDEWLKKRQRKIKKKD